MDSIRPTFAANSLGAITRVKAKAPENVEAMRLGSKMTGTSLPPQQMDQGNGLIQHLLVALAWLIQTASQKAVQISTLL